MTDVVKPGGCDGVLEMLNFDEQTEIDRLLKVETNLAVELARNEYQHMQKSEEKEQMTNDDNQFPTQINREDASEQRSSGGSVKCEKNPPNPFKNITDLVKESSQKSRRTSLPAEIRTSKSLPAKNLDEFYIFLDEYEKKTTNKRKEADSSPEKDVTQDTKTAKKDTSDETLTLSSSHSPPRPTTPVQKEVKPLEVPG